MSEVTRILEAIDVGDKPAIAQLMSIVYDELHRIAAAKLASERNDHTLQPTALVSEAYIRLVGDGENIQLRNRAHFFGAAAEAMRRILIDSARQKQALRRGGNRQRIDWESIEHPAAQQPQQFIALNVALEKLERSEPRKANLIKLRFFAGLTNQQAAEALGIATSTADRDWSYARAWLQVEMENHE